MVNKPVIIYGAGYKGGREFIRISEENIHVAAFCDQAAAEKRHYYGIPVFSLEELLKEKEYIKLPVIIGIEDSGICDKILCLLKGYGIDAYRNFDEYYTGKADIDINTNLCGGRSDGYGSYRIVDKLFPNRTGVAYTFGIGNDCTFEEELINKYHFEVYSFDPTPNSVEYINKCGILNKYGSKFHFYGYAISNTDGEKAFRKSRDMGTYSEDITPWTTNETDVVPVFRLKTLMKKFGHSKLDLLKMDIEGAEYHVIPDILSSTLQIDQICIEIHSRMYEDSVEKSREIKKLMNNHGYKLIKGNSIRDYLYVHYHLCN